MAGGEGAQGRMANVLMSALGAQSMAPSIGLVDLNEGDWLVLCTDGLTKHVPDDAITATLSASANPDEACTRLVDAALEAGGTDNVTVVTALFAP
jgi:protein phosphatase